MASTPSPRSTPAPTSASASPRTEPLTQQLPDRTIPSFQLDSAEAQTKGSFVPARRRPTLNFNGSDDGRRPSVQFKPHNSKEPNSRSSSSKPASLSKGVAGSNTARRLSSPPPPPQFRPSVSFDTFNNPSASDFSLTLNRKHRDYEYTKRSRTFLVGTDVNEYSDSALEWLIDELVDDGDEVVCLRVLEKDSKEATRWAGGQGEKGYKEEAERFLDRIMGKNTDDKAISLVLEFSIGKVQEAIQQMVRIYEPAILVVGTRGKSLTGYTGLLSSGSVSKYCLQYSPVPVIVVRSSSSREKKKHKRLRDPSRTGYRDILDKSEEAPRGKGRHLLDQRNRMSLMGAELGALGQLEGHGDPDEEARRVAEAIGYRDHTAQTSSSSEARGSSLSRVASAGSATSARSEARSDDTNMASPPLERLMKSPELRDMDSPMPSDDEAEMSDLGDAEVGRLQESLRPEDEAALLAYERAQKVFEEEEEEREERVRRKARSTSRGRSRTGDDDGEGEGRNGGASVLGLLAQLDRGGR